MNPVIKLQDVGKKLGEFYLNSISFDVKNSEIVGLLGRNGAGKTTTIKAILNMIALDSGKIQIMDKPNIEIDYGNIGVVFEECNYFNNFTILELEKIQKNLFKGWSSAKYYSYVEEFELPKKKQIKEFSQGMRKQICLITALSANPNILILDEITSGLDPLMRIKILNLLKDFIKADKHCVLFSTHIMEDIVKVADRIVILNKGCLVADKKKEELLAQSGERDEVKRLEDVFLRIIEER